MSAVVSPIRPKKHLDDAGPVWLSPEQVCERVPGLTTRNLQELRAKGRGPAYNKPTLKTVVYEQSVIDSWVAASIVKTRDTV